MCPPMLRWQHHTRMRCHTFASGSSPDNTASNRKLRLTTPLSVDATRNRPYCWKPVTQIERQPVATVQEDESLRRSALLLHVQRKTCFARVFSTTTHEVGTASAAQVDRSHDVSPLLGAEVSEAHPKRVGREGGLASQSSPRRTTKNDSMNVGRVALLDVRTRDLASSERISLEDERGFCQACGKVSSTRATVTNKVRPTLRATWMLSRTSRDRNTQRKDSQVLSQDVPLSVLDAKEPTKQQHDTLW